MDIHTENFQKNQQDLDIMQQESELNLNAASFINEMMRCPHSIKHREFLLNYIISLKHGSTR